MTYDKLPEGSLRCLHLFKRQSCKGCYPIQYDFPDNSEDILPPSSGRKIEITHDELLAQILENLSDCGSECETCKIDDAPWIALLAVVELHKPISKDKRDACAQCSSYSYRYLAYPCPTIQAIEKELI